MFSFSKYLLVLGVCTCPLIVICSDTTELDFFKCKVNQSIHMAQINQQVAQKYVHMFTTSIVIVNLLRWFIRRRSELSLNFFFFCYEISNESLDWVLRLSFNCMLTEFINYCVHCASTQQFQCLLPIDTRTNEKERKKPKCNNVYFTS